MGRWLRGEEITGGEGHVAVGTQIHVPLRGWLWGERCGVERGDESILVPDGTRLSRKAERALLRHRGTVEAWPIWRGARRRWCRATKVDVHQCRGVCALESQDRDTRGSLRQERLGSKCLVAAGVRAK
jgi:hypothetical protein